MISPEELTDERMSLRCKLFNRAEATAVKTDIDLGAMMYLSLITHEAYGLRADCHEKVRS